MGILIILSEEGDEKLEWDVKDPNSVKAACEKFINLRKKGYFIYQVFSAHETEVKDFNPNSPPMFIRCMVKEGEQVNEFDEDAKKIVATPPMVGG